jgi:hypothetical protein
MKQVDTFKKVKKDLLTLKDNLQILKNYILILESISKERHENEAARQ